MTSGAEWGPGTTVAGRYVLVRRLGTGGSGEVWCADDLQGRRAVALKRLRLPRLPAARLEREAALVGGLDHPRIVKTTGLVRDGASLCLVQDYVAGGDSRRLRGRPWHEWAPVLLAVASALEAAHAAGLVHLDLNPGNVLLDEDGNARLADFGVAAALGETGTAAGSPYARSPAQWRGAPAEPADDAYGLGALAYEWLTGHPPHYPDITAARVLAGPPPIPRSPSLLPPAELTSLVMRLLTVERTERATLAEVRDCLSRLLAEGRVDGPEAQAAARAMPVLQPPPEVGPAGTAAGATGWRPPGPELFPAEGAIARPWWRSAGALLGSLGAAAAVAAVMLWKPAPLPVPKLEPNAAAARPAAAGATRDAKPGTAEAKPRVPTDPAELSRMAARKSAADEYRDAYRRERDRLAKLPVAAWAEAPWQQAQGVDAKAQTLYDGLEFDQAGAAWRDGLRQLQAVAAARGPALASALSAGAAALAKPDSAAAKAAFGQALAIQPGHAGAMAGMRRAGTLDEVTHLLDRARLDEQSGRSAEAMAGYRKALALDAATGAATAGIARLQRAGAEASWRGTLAEAWQQLAAGQRDAARASFERAARLRPGAPEVAEGLAQVEAGNRSARLAGLRTRAAAAEKVERWAEAEALYREALEAEPGVSFAAEGRERAGARARLDASLQGVVDDPKQALRPALRQMARVWLEQAAQQPAPRGRLQQQALTVARLVAAAERPVTLVLESDGQTQVTVMRVKRLGVIERATVEVLPGTVVVVGTRPGYRDVRREVEVAPDGNPAPLSVRCEEKI